MPLASLILFQIPYMLFVNPHPNRLGAWGDALNTSALSGIAFIVAGSFAEDNTNVGSKSWLTQLLERLIPFGRIFLCITVVAFGTCHLLYTKSIATLVPDWIPWHVFWTYFAGVCLIGSGTAIILRIRLKLMGTLLGTMIFLWVISLHIPRAIADPHSGKGNEIESAARALAESGAAFLVASAARGRRYRQWS